MLTKLYRKYISPEIREKIYEAFLGYMLLFFRNIPESTKNLYTYLFQKWLPDTEENRIYAFMGRHGIAQCPYSFTLKYKKMPIHILWDDQQAMYYVLHSGKRLYFPSSFNKKSIESTYRNLLLEQDPNSPHLYVSDINRLKGKTLLDIGTAEGIFTLEAIELINHAYLFECDEIWIAALNATFEPWKEKVTIIPKYVNDINDENNITIDTFLEGKDKANLFLKMDIEGSEQAALKGAKKLLNEAKDLDYSICTYHQKNDVVEIHNLLKSNHFDSEFSDRYLYFEKELRKAIIRRKF